MSNPFFDHPILGRTGDAPLTLETEGQMIQWVMPDLMGMKNIIVINDEAHHCYRQKPADEDDNNAARLWISGLEAVNRKLGITSSSTFRRRPSSFAAQATRKGRCFRGR